MLALEKYGYFIFSRYNFVVIAAGMGSLSGLSTFIEIRELCDLSAH